MFTVFGSCRIDLPHGNCINHSINFTHCTKEVIQMIHFLNNTVQLPYPYNIAAFRTAINNKTPINNTNDYKLAFDNAPVVIIELCSKKVYNCDNYYLHHFAVDTRTPDWNFNNELIHKNTIIYKQSAEEIETDMLEIMNLLKHKTVIWVSHINHSEILSHNAHIFHERQILIDIIKNICNKHNLNYLSPSECLAHHNLSDILDLDFSHYTTYGRELWFAYLINYCNLKTLCKSN